jgi:hypothetical protein
MKPQTIAVSMIATLAMFAALGVHAQGAPIEFRLTPDKANLAGCTRLDASLSRVHSFTLAGDKALLKSAGGINDTMKQASPNVYTTTFNMGGVRLDVVADTSKTPRTLTVAEAQRGCHWHAVAP